MAITEAMRVIMESNLVFVSKFARTLNKAEGLLRRWWLAHQWAPTEAIDEEPWDEARDKEPELEEACHESGEVGAEAHGFEECTRVVSRKSVHWLTERNG